MLNTTFYTESPTTQTMSPPDEIQALWQSTLEDLGNTMSRATFDGMLRDSTPVSMNDNLLTIAVTSEQAAEWLNGRMRNAVARTLTSVRREQCDVSFVTHGERANKNALPVLPQSVPHAREQAVESEYELSTQLFRKVWRPQLGPLLSELVRELRQLAREQGYMLDRNTAAVEITQAELAQALGISRRTLVRNVERDEQSMFKQACLNRFVLDMSPARGRDERGRIKNDRTRFVIRLNDPLADEE